LIYEEEEEKKLEEDVEEKIMILKMDISNENICQVMVGRTGFGLHGAPKYMNDTFQFFLNYFQKRNFDSYNNQGYLPIMQNNL
jgi:hypothetical protein